MQDKECWLSEAHGHIFMTYMNSKPWTPCLPYTLQCPTADVVSQPIMRDA